MGTVEIPLTRGKIALIDETDWPLVSQFSWSAQKDRNTFYAVATLAGFKPAKKMLMHRLLLGLASRKEEGDHINGNGLDNRRSNLRRATHSQNSKNHRQTRPRPVTSKYKGVHRRKHLVTPFVAQIGVNMERRHIGVFANEEDAARAYDAAAKQYHGEFASLNFPDAA